MKNRNNVLKKAFILADLEDFSNLPKQYDEWTPSFEFEQKMARLIRARKNPFWEFSNTVGKRVAIIIVAFMLLSGSALSVKAIREPVIVFIIETYEKFTAMFVETPTNGQPPEVIETEYLPTYMPDGYFQYDIKNSLFTLEAIYRKNNDEVISFTQNVIDGSHFIIDTEGVQLKTVNVHDVSGYYYVNKGYITLIWATDEYSFQISVSDTFPINEALRIAESVMQKND